MAGRGAGYHAGRSGASSLESPGAEGILSGMAEGNRVFDLLASWRAAAYRAQKWLAAIGALSLAAALALLVAGRRPAAGLALAAGLLLLLLSVVWGLAWRRRLERAFWRSARVPRRGEPLRLPLETK